MNEELKKQWLHWLDLNGHLPLFHILSELKSNGFTKGQAIALINDWWTEQ